VSIQQIIKEDIIYLDQVIIFVMTFYQASYVVFIADDFM